MEMESHEFDIKPTEQWLENLNMKALFKLCLE